MLEPVSTRPAFVEMEQRMLRWWRDKRMIDRYIKRNERSERRWSFIDGPITANNPMGVHHAWGRSYKDLWQRFHTMLGERQRYQNGFDCQGLWIEVEVEKEHGFKSKKDIVTYGVDKFVEDCKERVRHFAARQTEQSIRLGYWMDWDNSYYTNSDENNYTIWGFLKTCWERGWLYKGHDVMPWCPRCGTGLSEHEIVTDGYREITHVSVYVTLPLTAVPEGLRTRDEDRHALLVWTTTPWTLPGNVAAAVHPDLTYLQVRQGDRVFYVSKGAAPSAIRGEHEVVRELPGSALVGARYAGPFDDLPAAQGVEHRVVSWKDVSDDEGTGIVHIAPGCGREDFHLGKEEGLAVIAPADDEGNYVAGFAELTGRYVSAEETREIIFARLRESGALYRTQQYPHRYPHCWRCGTELIFRLVDEWYISMDELRPQMIEVTRQVRWLPEFGLAREIDWLNNMGDWMISKKRYYGLALPIYECESCGRFEVIGSETELRERAIAGWEDFDGHSPHRPWVDAVKIACGGCGAPVSRIADVGNPWLDAGIVPFSTLHYRDDREYWQQWFPAHFITEAFPGQFRNWFYSLLTMSTTLTGESSFRVVLGHAMVRDEHGDEMHKSRGNAIWFDDAADKMGADVMRWLFFRQNPAHNINFGYGPADEIRRSLFITLWNTYAFFVTYARIDGWKPGADSAPPAELDRWALSELHTLVRGVTDCLQDFDALGATKLIEAYVDDLSNWYVRRSRRRFWKSESDGDKQAAYATLHECLTTLTRLMAPFTPFLAEELYQNLVRGFDTSAPESVHLTDWPQPDAAKIDADLSRGTRLVMRIASLGRAARAKAQLKVRQPLAELYVKLTSADDERALERLSPQLLDELNVKAVRILRDESDFLRFELKPNLKLLGKKYGSGVQEIAAALQALDDDERSRIARAVAAGEGVAVAGRDLQPEELLVTGREREGFASAEEHGTVVAVSSQLTPELIREGIAREVVHRLQNLRKDAGFEIDDRICTSVDAGDDVRGAVEAFGDYVRQETLSTELTFGPPRNGAHSESADLDGHAVTLAVAKA